MTNKETAEAIRLWASKAQSSFSWPTDGCGYDQHARFVSHRNENWSGGPVEDFKLFALAYTDAIECEPDAAEGT